MAYATYEDVQARMTRELTADEQAVCTALLDDAAVMIDSYNSEAGADVKSLVSIRMVMRAMSDTVQTPMYSTCSLLQHERKVH